jgi:hypothetical protein
MSLAHSGLYIGGSMEACKCIQNSAQMDTKAVIRLGNDPAGSLGRVMLETASSVMQQTARLTIVVARQLALAL